MRAEQLANSSTTSNRENSHQQTQSTIPNSENSQEPIRRKVEP